jgi:hypothetical protein
MTGDWYWDEPLLLTGRRDMDMADRSGIPFIPPEEGVRAGDPPLLGEEVYSI